MPPDEFVWIPRWPEFQHYRPNPDRGPAWIKTHTAQLADDRYLQLTDRQRSLLHDVRMMFATFRGRLAYDRRTITRQRNVQTRYEDVKALVDAGLLLLVSREVLEQRLEEFYRPSSLEVEKEEEKKPPTPFHKTSRNKTENPTENGAPPQRLCPECGPIHLPQGATLNDHRWNIHGVEETAPA